MSFFLAVKDLPNSIQLALKSVEYHKADIKIEIEEKFYTRPPSSKGRKGFVAACQLSSNEYNITWGSFGGSNMFVKTIDDIDECVSIPDNVAFISGMSSAGPGYPSMATIHISPQNMNASLLPKTVSISEKEQKALAIFMRLKPFVRKEYLARANISDAEIATLVCEGYLKRNKAGAISITLKGKNSAGKNYF